jgi:hypothetical protein
MKGILLIVVALFSFTISYAQDKSFVVGKWQVEISATFNAIDGNEKVRLDGMTEDKRKKIKQSFENRLFIFETNDLVRMIANEKESGNEVTGSWSYNKHGHKLTINGGGRSSLYTVVKVDDNNIKLVYDNPLPQGLFKSLFLRRRN